MMDEAVHSITVLSTHIDSRTQFRFLLPLPRITTILVILDRKVIVQ
jgi:phage gp36-like protein